MNLIKELIMLLMVLVTQCGCLTDKGYQQSKIDVEELKESRAASDLANPFSGERIENREVPDLTYRHPDERFEDHVLPHFSELDFNKRSKSRKLSDLTKLIKAFFGKWGENHELLSSENQKTMELRAEFVRYKKICFIKYNFII